MIYERPSYYAVVHGMIGFASVWIPLIGILALVYQLGQYVFNVRVFFIEGDIRPGNSWEHTGVKLGEMTVGFCVGHVLRGIIHTI
jgi:hypothetical protein